MMLRPSVCCLLLGFLLASCSAVHPVSDIVELNQVYRIRPRQTLHARTPQGSVQRKYLTHPARAALYKHADTLFAEFIANTLRPPDGNPATLDRSDSAAVLFVNYNARLDRLEEKSPWFYYQLSTFDADLFTNPFKYRFGEGGQPGELIANPNVGVYLGIRYDLGRHRTVDFRRQRRSDIQSFSFGFGGFGNISPVLVNEFGTAGRFTGEYQALGINYGLLTLVGYKTVTVGLALGFEQLADQNNPVWIYRNKPWLGVTIGLNLN